jgi:hypothetical protein
VPKAFVEPFRGKTLCAQACGDLLLIVHGESTPAEAEWAEMLAFTRGQRARALLVITPKNCRGPTATQRSAAAATWEGLGYRAPMVMITDSRLSRGMMTAVRWLTKQSATAYAPEQFGRACEQLGLDEAACASVRTEAFALARHLHVEHELSYLDPAGGERSVAV